MKEKRLLYFALGVLAVVGFGAVTNQVAPLSTAGGMTVGDTGITFPDGSAQTTAATGPVTAWPMRCQDTFLENDGSHQSLTCETDLPVPGGTFGEGDGVPDGYFFVVTDVVLSSATSTSTGLIRTFLQQHDSLGNFKRNQMFQLSSDVASQSTSFQAPLFVLVRGDYLTAANSMLSDTDSRITVTGYLTDQPEKLGL